MVRHGFQPLGYVEGMSGRRTIVMPSRRRCVQAAARTGLPRAQGHRLRGNQAQL